MTPMGVRNGMIRYGQGTNVRPARWNLRSWVKLDYGPETVVGACGQIFEHSVDFGVKEIDIAMLALWEKYTIWCRSRRLGHAGSVTHQAFPRHSVNTKTSSPSRLKNIDSKGAEVRSPIREYSYEQVNTNIKKINDIEHLATACTCENLCGVVTIKSRSDRKNEDRQEMSCLS